MKFAYTRLITEDLPSLITFYEELLGLKPMNLGKFAASSLRAQLFGFSVALLQKRRMAAIGSAGTIARSSSNSKWTMWMRSASGSSLLSHHGYRNPGRCLGAIAP